jgi:hypothetical protein
MSDWADEHERKRLVEKLKYGTDKEINEALDEVYERGKADLAKELLCEKHKYMSAVGGCRYCAYERGKAKANSAEAAGGWPDTIRLWRRVAGCSSPDCHGREHYQAAMREFFNRGEAEMLSEFSSAVKVHRDKNLFVFGEPEATKIVQDVLLSADASEPLPCRHAVALELFGMWLDVNAHRITGGYLTGAQVIGAWDDARDNRIGQFFSLETVEEAKRRCADLERVREHKND